MSRVPVVLVAALVLALPAAARAAELTGPPGTSSSKVLVIGTDGTRIDKVRQAIAAGDAPRLAAIADDGFAVPSLLDYAPPSAFTLSEVGWATIATGVWPAKHGVTGVFLNNDPRQATKNGYPDFLTRIERERPALSTFIASDWPNIATHANGGPIFGDGIDARATVVPGDTLDDWDRADQQIADTAAGYLRDGDPDASFVYFGIVDESAHLAGSATPRYLQAIRDTDRRIGQLLDAIRARPAYLAERWIVVVTTDHGQQDLSTPSPLSHGGASDLERTSFIAATGFGVRQPAFAQLRVVDVAPTVFARLGIPIDAAWDLDGRPFSALPDVPAPVASARRRGHTLTVVARAPQGAPALRALAVRVAGRRAATRSRTAAGARRLTLRLEGVPRARVRVTLTDAGGTQTTLRPQVSGRR